MRTPPEPQDPLGDLKKAEPPPPPPPVDSYTQVNGCVWKNEKTGAFETFNHRPGKAPQ